MTGIVITGGDRPSFSKVESLIRNAEYIVAADSGLEYCNMHRIEPDYIIGDMDSLENKELLDSYSNVQVERHPEEKDFTDTELGLNHLYEKGFKRTVLIGGGGGRPDHFLAIYALFFQKRKPDLWITNDSVFQLIKGKMEFELSIGSELSLFPLSSNCRMKSKGLYWPLDSLKWNPGDHGISNKTTEKIVVIEVLQGEFLMIQELESVNLPS